MLFFDGSPNTRFFFASFFTRKKPAFNCFWQNFMNILSVLNDNGCGFRKHRVAIVGEPQWVFGAIIARAFQLELPGKHVVYHFIIIFLGNWIAVLGVKMMEIDSNLFSR